MFILDTKIMLDSMAWTKFEQKEKDLLRFDPGNYFSPLLKLGGNVYKDHLFVLEKSLDSQGNALCFLNLRIYFFAKFF